MAKTFNVGDHVRWNSEAGRVSGVIRKKITSNAKLKGYVRHASKEAPQYVIKSDKTDHVAIHKGNGPSPSCRAKEVRQEDEKEIETLTSSISIPSTEPAGLSAQRWGVWAVGFSLPMNNRANGGENLESVLPALKSRWSEWKAKFS